MAKDYNLVFSFKSGREAVIRYVPEDFAKSFLCKFSKTKATSPKECLTFSSPECTLYIESVEDVVVLLEDSEAVVLIEPPPR